MKIFHVHSLHGFFNISTWLTAIAGEAVLLIAFHLVSRSSAFRSRSGRGWRVANVPWPGSTRFPSGANTDQPLHWAKRPRPLHVGTRRNWSRTTRGGKA
jgi:hypothetical protein